MKTNRMDKWRRILTMLCIASVIGFTACDDDDDIDMVDVYDNERFFSDYRASNLFADSDTNSDQFWDEDEFNENAFNTWDTDRNGTIDQNEFTRAAADFRVNNTTWSAWDTDANNSLNRQEFMAGYGQNNFFRTWDTNTDNRLSEREFTDGTFAQMDASGTGNMTAADYNRFGSTYFGF